MSKLFRFSLLGAVIVAALPLAAPAAASTLGMTSRVAPSGSQPNGEFDANGGVAMSADGRYLAFSSRASNLVPGDTNGTPDVFVHDRRTGAIRRVSVASDGTQLQGGGWSIDPAISADGRYVAFRSDAADLVPGDTNQTIDVFVHDTSTATTIRASVGPAGEQADDGSHQPALSGDGRFLAFTSSATNLVPGDTNNQSDVFVRDLHTGVTTRVSVDSAGSQTVAPWSGAVSELPSISADGRFVAFRSFATNLVPGDTNGTTDMFVHDRQAGTTTRVSVAGDGSQATEGGWSGAITPDGSAVVFVSSSAELVPGDTNGSYDVFAHDRQAGTITRLNVASDGTQAVSSTTWISRLGVTSADGRYVTFHSDAFNLAPGDTNGGADVFVHDRHSGTTTRVSVTDDGRQASAGSTLGSISSDGRYVSFSSTAANLVPGDTNGFSDVFVRTAGPPSIGSVSPSALVQGASNVTLEITGSNFTATPSVTIAGVSVNAVSLASANRVTANLTVAASASPGPRDVVVTNPAGDSVACAGCFTVEARSSTPPPPAPPAPPSSPAPPPASADPVLTPAGLQSGYWMITGAGDVHSFGDARHHGSDVATAVKRVDIEPTPNGNGYWILAESGAVHAKGDAQWHGSALNALRTGEKAAALSSTPKADGYWIFTDRGRVLTFGAAQHFGDMSAVALNGPVLDSVATASGAGYWMVGSDGGIFNFGDARFYGSTGNMKLNKPVMSMAPDPDGVGYWLVASDGGIFAFDASFYGSMGGSPLNKPISGMVTGPAGYLMVAEDGGIFAFGNVKFHGSLGANPPSSPVVAVALLS